MSTSSNSRPSDIDRSAAEDSITERSRLWAATMQGFASDVRDDVVTAHDGHRSAIHSAPPRSRLQREAEETLYLAEGATRAKGAGSRRLEEAADPLRTCFERDRDRIVHSSAFRRLAGKTQVFLFPDDHQRTRLTHAIEVAQVATAISEALKLNRALTEAIALGHDCGHGPGGHPSEDAFAEYLSGGFDHAPFGADVMLRSLNLCEETLDGIRNHSWSRPAPMTPEGEVVSWADRIAYVCHDWQDALTMGIVTGDDLPAIVVDRCGSRHARQVSALIDAVIEATSRTGTVGMSPFHAEALAAFRATNYERVYLRPESLIQAKRVRRLLEGLVEAYAQDPNLLPLDMQDDYVSGSAEAFARSVTYVAGMTDRFAIDAAQRLLSWPTDELPNAVSVSSLD